jgi:hypothetical protein
MHRAASRSSRCASARRGVASSSSRRSLSRTVISSVWAASIDLSGQTAVAQILRDFDHAAEPWGPQVIVVPQLASELDEAAWPEPAFDENNEQEAREWRELDACLLGHDFLRNISAMLIGERGLLALFDFEQPPQAA